MIGLMSKDPRRGDKTIPVAFKELDIGGQRYRALVEIDPVARRTRLVYDPQTKTLYADSREVPGDHIVAFLPVLGLCNLKVEHWPNLPQNSRARTLADCRSAA